MQSFFRSCASVIALLIIPLSALARQPLDVVFVIDSSGSMTTKEAGFLTRMDLSARAVELFAIGMTEKDRVAVVNFNWEICGKTPFQALNDAGFDSLNNFVYSITADGSTDILKGIKQAGDIMKQASAGKAERQRAVILLTDGQMCNTDPRIMTSTYGDGSPQWRGEKWRPQIALAADWLKQNHVPVYTIVIGTDNGSASAPDIQFASVVSEITGGGLEQAAKAEDLRVIYQRLWHQLAGRPVPRQNKTDSKLVVEVGERTQEMQVILSGENARTMGGIGSRIPLAASFFLDNTPVETMKDSCSEKRTRQGRNAVAYVLTKPRSGAWAIEAKGRRVDVWVDIESWWSLQARKLGSSENVLDVEEPFEFDVAVIDDSTGLAVSEPRIVGKIRAEARILAQTDKSSRLFAAGVVPLTWDSSSSSFKGRYFSADGKARNVDGFFNALCQVQLNEMQETLPHTLRVCKIDPDGVFEVSPQDLQVYMTCGFTNTLALVSDKGQVFPPVLFLRSDRKVNASATVRVSDLLCKASGLKIEGSAFQVSGDYTMEAGRSSDLRLTLDLSGTRGRSLKPGLYEGTLTILSSSRKVRGCVVPLHIEIGGQPVQLSFSAVLEPGKIGELSTPLNIPERMRSLLRLDPLSLKMVGSDSIIPVSFDVRDSKVFAKIDVPLTAKGGVYSAESQVIIPGLVPGLLTVRLSVLRTFVVPSRIDASCIPGTVASCQLELSNNVPENIVYLLKASELTPEPGAQGNITLAMPREVRTVAGVPANVEITATVDKAAKGAFQGEIRVTGPSGGTSVVPVHATCISLAIEKLTRSDIFRCGAGRASSPIEYKVTTTSQRPLNVRVSAEDLITADGRILPAGQMKLQAGAQAAGSGVLEFDVTAAKPALFNMSCLAPEGANGLYSGNLIVTGQGVSEVKEPVAVEVGALRIEGKDPFRFPLAGNNWDGKVRLLTNVKQPVRIQHSVSADPSLSKALSVNLSASDVSAASPLDIDISIDPQGLPVGIHEARVKLDGGDIAGANTLRIVVNIPKPEEIGFSVIDDPAFRFDNLSGEAVSQARKVAVNTVRNVSIAAELINASVVPPSSIKVSQSATYVSQNAPVLLTVQVDSKGLIPGDYSVAVRVKPEKDPIVPLDIPVLIKVAGLKDLSLIAPAKDELQGGVATCIAGTPVLLKFRGQLSGSVTREAVRNDYRVTATLLKTGENPRELLVKAVVSENSGRDFFWGADCGELKTGRYEVRTVTENQKTGLSRQVVHEFYVLPRFDCAMVSGGLIAGAPMKFVARSPIVHLAGISNLVARITLKSPDKKTSIVEMKDDGKGADDKAADGQYSCAFLLPATKLGRWTWKDSYQFQIEGHSFELDPERELDASVGVSIEGATISLRDPASLVLNNFVSHYNRHVSIQVNTTAEVWTNVSMSAGEVRRVGTDKTAGKLPVVKFVAGESRARAREPFMASLSLSARWGLPEGLYQVPLDITVGVAPPQRVLLEFEVLFMPWKIKLLIVLGGFVVLYLFLTLFLLRMGSAMSAIYCSSKTKEELVLEPLSANQIGHGVLPVAILDTTDRELFGRHASVSPSDRLILRVLRIPFDRFKGEVYVSVVEGDVRLNGQNFRRGFCKIGSDRFTSRAGSLMIVHDADPAESSADWPLYICHAIGLVMGVCIPLVLAALCWCL